MCIRDSVRTTRILFPNQVAIGPLNPLFLPSFLKIETFPILKNIMHPISSFIQDFNLFWGIIIMKRIWEYSYFVIFKVFKYHFLLIIYLIFRQIGIVFQYPFTKCLFKDNCPQWLWYEYPVNREEKLIHILFYYSKLLSDL